MEDSLDEPEHGPTGPLGVRHEPHVGGSQREVRRLREIVVHQYEVWGQGMGELLDRRGLADGGHHEKDDFWFHTAGMDQYRQNRRSSTCPEALRYLICFRRVKGRALNTPESMPMRSNTS